MSSTLPLSQWQINTAGRVIELPKGVLSRKSAERLHVVFDYAEFPEKKDGNWKPAPIVNGKVEYRADSKLHKKYTDKYTHVDFTYYRAFLDLTAITDEITSAEITIGQVDDQARMMLFNSQNMEGYYIEANDAQRGGQDMTVDFTDHLVKGEINTFFVVQVDDNPMRNELKGGIKVTINGNEIQPDPTWDEKHPDFIKNEGYTDIAFEVVGDATGKDGEYTLTPDQNNKAGAVWTKYDVNLSKDFEIQAEIYLGNKAHNGADGLALVFQNTGNNLLGKGHGLGYTKLSDEKDLSSIEEYPSFIIEFDTLSNKDNMDPLKNHVGKLVNGNPKHNDPKDYKEISYALEDGKYHPIVFRWYGKTQSFDLTLDGKEIFTNDKFTGSTLNPDEKVFFGFTSSTGMLSNLHKVRAISFATKPHHNKP